MSDEQQAVDELFESFFDKECSSQVVRHAEPLGFDPSLWAKLDALGGPAMGVPAALGGGGASCDVLAVVAERVGRAAAPIPLVDHLVASRALAAPNDEVLAGAQIATVAVRAARAGTWSLVPSGAIASIIVGVYERTLVGTRSDPPMAAPRNHASMPIADRSVEGGDVAIAADVAWDRVHNEWKVLTASSLVGLAHRALELGVGYAHSRSQFGRPIGAFQAVQHGFADLPGLVDGARLLVQKAAWALDREAGRPVTTIDPFDNEVTDPTALASMAYLFASEVASTVTDQALHYQGAFGYSSDGDIQLYFRRARGWSLIHGDRDGELLELADVLFGAT
jgi:alkylation response protein AidB-like acyl-CoA dehydrogenase